MNFVDWENGDEDKGSEDYPDYIVQVQFIKTSNRADSIDTYEDNINFQVSSEVCGGMLLCATYGTIYANNELEVTHNC
ncbi:hypothetical protein HPY28_11740 [Brevibacillus sp. HB1.2]|nr:hypothetical protein A616_05570 [Brevibacillus brevis X23]NTU20990.1 hypothetical protein [Brevibacillus sp. HB1.2]NTU30920.1 hypothetical protein [Brevibacillus sp. HB1.1]